MDTPTPEKADKQGMPLTSHSPIPLKNVQFRDPILHIFQHNTCIYEKDM